ncbi:outer membrane protein assembly factor BamD [Planctomyces sp. SH-PL62]|uniref:outer membrane protein assembly factor BamD n=1 Tax=Planctomyces sp. SH-PL62 TaxID=1636152 RepID=UPI00078C678B|nr:outer membrane protein assembly factor BamD [Planctomyces sp. SH-PL62]AMV36710.1 Outer membrane protein assembly factor BamD [Planctomyces sp. SH-PL62]
MSRSSRWPLAARVASVALIVGSAAGCQSFSVPFAQWRATYDSGLAKPIGEAELARAKTEKLADSDTLLKRWLSPRDPEAGSDEKTVGDRDSSGKVLGSNGWSPFAKPKIDPDAQKELDDAFARYEAGDLAAAEAAFAKIAKARKESPWGEKAQFYLAETQFKRKKYVAAHESFERLASDYPGTQRMDDLVSREYEIAQIWMAQSDPKAKAEQKLPWYSHFNGQQPLIDTRGMGLKALEHVRHHAPDGPLADDAVMQIAGYHMTNADYESAAIYYDEMITTHPKSPFLHEAHMAAIDARVKGYLGPDYDGEGLEQARDLVRKTMQTFPDKPEGQEGLYHTLDLINDQEAERTYNVGAYYKKIGKVASAEYYFGKIPQRWPESPWAVKAKSDLASLAKQPRKSSLPSKMMAQPGANDPYYSAGAGGMNAMGGMGMSPGGMM